VRRALPAIVAALLLLVAACSDDGDDDPEPAAEAPQADAPAGDVVGAAVDATLAEGSARLELTTEIDGLPGSDEPVVAEGEGVVDFESGASTVTLDLASVLQGIGLPGLDGEVESRSVGDERWLRSPFFNTVLGVTTEWLLLDVGAADGEVDGLGQVGALTGNDPADQLRLVAAVDPASVEAVGEEDVRGDATTRYRGTLDPADAPEDVPDTLVDQLGSAPIDVDVWVDGDGLVRRVATAVPLPPAAGGGAAQVELDLFDFGVDVSVEAPADDEVTRASELTDPGP
jgi:hypothetical protein